MNYFITSKEDYERHKRVQDFLERARKNLPAFLRSELPEGLSGDDEIKQGIRDAVPGMIAELSKTVDTYREEKICTVTSENLYIFPDGAEPVTGFELVITDEYGKTYTLDEFKAYLLAEFPSKTRTIVSFLNELKTWRKEQS